MTVAIKNDNTAPLIVSPAMRRKAGFKNGQKLEVKVSEGVITIVPKLTPHETEDEREIRDPKIRAAIRKGYQDFLDGKALPIEEIIARRAARARKRPSR